MSETELRAMVRDVLREALGKGGQPKPKPVPVAAAPSVESVRVTSDTDLAALVHRLIKILDDPVTGKALRAGDLRFTLSGQQAAPATAAAAPVGAASVLQGTVTEARINKLAGAGMILLAPDAVITPLARDRARALGLKIERRR